ncbi:peptidase M20 domain-containing protein 2-like isoform X1 [Sphaeramia orbicularis]|uniref:peptidase M20 domain-containing protein 2-like isoform X1 n=1 Tax=Sphaeramia orbicularis TaxID=375764 RepID=UPI00117EC7A0|nr:peptidase M20 domain-containing protein 2-like isoform X1 [Sphaeramia orbicularis]XP_029985265.1 peptidase M20 domain-containing protein 2-like isoform X1 [Sphaeramia orbicularis]
MSSSALLSELKHRLGVLIDAAEPKLHGLSRDIWTCPELAYQETQAHGTLVDFFSQEPGWTVDPHFKLDTAFRAVWGPELGPGPVVNVGFLCEFDALPGLGHACGHNLIAEVGAAAALGLKAVLEELPDRSSLPVRVQVTVLGTPAEEDGGGKIDMLREGAFEGLDVVFMAHPSKEDALYLPCVAEHDVTIRYYGRASHASAYPWEGVNALDAAVLCYNSLSVLRQQLKPDWRVHGIIKNGGVKPNIIPDYTELEFYLRTPSRAELPVLKEKAERCFRSAAEATGCTVEVEFSKNRFDNMLRFWTLEQLYEQNGTALGMEFTTDEEVLKESGSTDFGNVTFAVPGIHPYFYIGANALVHTQEYTSAAGDARAQFYALRTAKALSMTALDLLMNPQLLQKIKEEFTEEKHKEEDKETRLSTQRT